MIRFVLPIAALASTGCVLRNPPHAVPAPPGVECNSNGLDGLIGKTRSDAVAAEARRLSGANVVRWLTPGMMVTMEFRPDRLNLHLGANGKIRSVVCG